MDIPIGLLYGRHISLSRDQATALTLAVFSVTLLVQLSAGTYLPLYFFTLALSAAVIWRHPAVGIYVSLVLTMWFERHFTLAPLTIFGTVYKIYSLDILLLITGIAAMGAFFQGKARLSFSRLDAPILFFGALALLAYLRSSGTASLDTALAVSALKNYFLYAVLYLYAAVLLRTEDEWRSLFHWISLGGIGLFFFLIYGLAFGQGLWTEYTPLSTLGTRLIAGTHVFYMVLFGFWVLSAYVWHSREEGDNPTLLEAILLFLGIGILVSLVRHLWVALGLLFTLFLFLFSKQERARFLSLFFRGASLIIFTALLGTWVYALVFGEAPRELSRAFFVLSERLNISSVASLSDASFGWRVAGWNAGLDLWSTAPIFGIGFGHSVQFVFDTFAFQIPVRDLHNDYLGILIQLGGLGALTIMAWFGMLFGALASLWKSREGRTVFERRLLFTSMSWIFLFTIGFSISVYWDINLFIVWWWVALAGVRWLYEEQRR